MTIFYNRTSPAPESGGDVFSGAWAYPESSSCCGRSLWYSPLLVGSIMGQYAFVSGDPWMREMAVRQLILQTYDAHETGVTEDNIDGGIIVNGAWFNIAHPLPLYWVQMAIGWLPEELGAGRENHIVRSSAVVKSVCYGDGDITYSTFDAPAKAVVKDSDMEYSFVLIHRPGDMNELPEKLRKLPCPTLALPRGRTMSQAFPNRFMP